jgi:hypothetical protein
MRARLDMRNGQFSHPVPDERMIVLRSGRCEPLAFDFARAGLTP